MANGSNGLCRTNVGQHHQFHHYNSGKSNWGEERYFKIARIIYKDLDERLEKINF